MTEELISNNEINERRQPCLPDRQACEVYSRIVGYLRPVGQWNKGKRAEFGDRRTYDRQLSESLN